MLTVFVIAVVLFLIVKGKNKTKTQLKRKSPKQITEIKCTCLRCENVFYYGHEQVFKDKIERDFNAGTAGVCCSTGCVPLLFIPSPVKKEQNLNRCPKCGSAALKKETISYDVE